MAPRRKRRAPAKKAAATKNQQKAARKSETTVSIDTDTQDWSVPGCSGTAPGSRGGRSAACSPATVPPAAAEEPAATASQDATASYIAASGLSGITGYAGASTSATPGTSAGTHRDTPVPGAAADKYLALFPFFMERESEWPRDDKQVTKLKRKSYRKASKKRKLEEEAADMPKGDMPPSKKKKRS